MKMPLVLDDDRLFPVEPNARAIARDLYESVAHEPIISPHGHVDPRLLLDNKPFSDAANLFLTYDHYVFRLLNSAGVDLHELGVGKSDPVDPRAAWRIFCRHWRLFDGTSSGYWLTHELVTLFGIDCEPSEETADEIFDAIQEKLAQPEFRPRALFDSFPISFLATTDDPLDSLEYHAVLANDPSFSGRVVPTWRPDAYVNARKPEFISRVEALTASVNAPVDSLAGYLEALRASRARFIEHGAVSADFGVAHPLTVDLDDAELETLYRKAVIGSLTAEEADAFEGAMLLRFAGMSVDDGLVMTIHPGVLRNHHEQSFESFGADTGHDIPVATEFTKALRPMLNKYGSNRDLHVVLFTLDETVYSREIAPLAGFYPSVFIGAPWWFIDAPDAIARFRAATTETAGFSRASGFIDDTRAFLSIPARHDMSRRVDSAFLARYVAQGRISLAAAQHWIKHLTVDQPKKVFKID
ncbi:glucuronate isomerase [Arcanobacterium pluranimalium]|nr:glucuronate isomerase [Arcanobacterium pluranimalium]